MKRAVAVGAFLVGTFLTPSVGSQGTCQVWDIQFRNGAVARFEFPERWHATGTTGSKLTDPVKVKTPSGKVMARFNHVRAIIVVENPRPC